MVGPCMHVLCKVFYENIYHIFVTIVTVHSKQWMGQIGCLWPYKKLSQQFKFTVCTKTNPHCIAYYWAVKTFSNRILWCPYVWWSVGQNINKSNTKLFKVRNYNKGISEKV